MLLRKGFSLIEALITMVLMLAVMAMVAAISSNFSNVLRFSAAKESSRKAVQVALERMVSDLRTATSINQPALGGTSSQLVFQQFDPGSAARLDSTGYPLLQPANLYPAYQLTVNYSLDLQGTLWRGATGPGGNYAVAYGIGGVSFQRSNLLGHDVVLSITVQEVDEVFVASTQTGVIAP